MNQKALMKAGFLGCTAVAATIGCSLALDLEPVRDNTGVAGSPSGGVAGSAGSSVQGAGGQSSTGGTVSGQSFGGASAGSPSTGGTFGSGGGSVLTGAAGSAGESPVSSGGGPAIGGSGGVAGTASSIVAGAAGATTVVPKSCQNPSPLCQGESCCTTIVVPGGTFKMGRSEDNDGEDDYADGASWELPEHDTKVSAFALDKYEVTVGRFRSFVEDYDAWHKAPASHPLIGEGRNENANASVRSLTGWGENWTVKEIELPVDSNALRQRLGSMAYSNWTDAPAGNEAFPMNGMTWSMAFAFCIWDGGRLPTEAEWEYVAAGGSGNFLFPWGRNWPDSSRANFVRSFNSPKLAVGGRPNGDGVYGHRDLAGSMAEWVLDWFLDNYYGTAIAPAICDNCVSVKGNDLRSIRGGGWWEDETHLRSAFRGNQNYLQVLSNVGIRCAKAAR